LRRLSLGLYQMDISWMVSHLGAYMRVHLFIVSLVRRSNTRIRPIVLPSGVMAVGLYNFMGNSTACVACGWVHLPHCDCPPLSLIG